MQHHKACLICHVPWYDRGVMPSMPSQLCTTDHSSVGRAKDCYIHVLGVTIMCWELLRQLLKHTHVVILRSPIRSEVVGGLIFIAMHVWATSRLCGEGC
jgi:hypothetical protein